MNIVKTKSHSLAAPTAVYVKPHLRGASKEVGLHRLKRWQYNILRDGCIRLSNTFRVVTYMNITKAIRSNSEVPTTYRDIFLSHTTYISLLEEGLSIFKVDEQGVLLCKKPHTLRWHRVHLLYKDSVVYASVKV